MYMNHSFYPLRHSSVSYCIVANIGRQVNSIWDMIYVYTDELLCTRQLIVHLDHNIKTSLMETPMGNDAATSGTQLYRCCSCHAGPTLSWHLAECHRWYIASPVRGGSITVKINNYYPAIRYDTQGRESYQSRSCATTYQL